MTVPKFLVKQEPDGRWFVDVRGTLPSGRPFRHRTHPKVATKRQADDFAAGVWRSALNDERQERQPTTTVEEYARGWLEAREARGLSSAVTNRYELARILPLLGSIRLVDLTRGQIAEALRLLELEGESKRGGGPLSPRSVRHSYNALRTMLEDARDEGRIPTNPATLKARRDEIPNIRDKDPHWRRSAVYTAAEVRALTSDGRVPAPARVAYALEVFTGLRYGEASALRWESWEPDLDPLGRLVVHEAYDSNNSRIKTTKTDATRWVPVLPELGAMLEDWWAAGWRRAYGRAPRPGDLVIPVRDGQLRHRTKNDGYDPHVRALRALGLPHRRQHDLRRTFVTLCMAGGASKDLLKWISHGPPRGVVIDAYTSPPWPTLCRQVECFALAFVAQLGQDDRQVG